MVLDFDTSIFVVIVFFDGSCDAGIVDIGLSSSRRVDSMAFSDSSIQTFLD